MQIIIQSAPSSVSGPIKSAMETVREYANRWGYDYKFFGDAMLFDCVPIQWRNKDIILQTDIGRLFLMERMLSTYDKVVWIDADVHVISERLRIPKHIISFANEAWLQGHILQRFPANYILSATSKKPLRKLYEEWCLWAATHPEHKWYSFSTEVIRNQSNPKPTENTLNLSDSMYKHMLHGDGYIPELGPIYAVNLKTSTNSTVNTHIILERIRQHNTL